jgi:hypothetical protein
MITKQQYLDSYLREIDIIKHLAEKVTPAMLEYRPTPGQRSMLELMQYLGQVSGTVMTVFIHPDQNYAELKKAGDLVTFENFTSKMDEQAQMVTDLITPLTDDQLASEVSFFGMNHPLNIHLLNALKWITAYKMQLFLYIKANGVDTIGTSNVWGGKDMPPKE